MTDEKKPPQEVAACAQIVLDINQDGLVRMSATCFGKPDSTYSTSLPDDRLLLNFQILFVLSELRLQIKQGRYLTIEESAAVMAEVRQSSAPEVQTLTHPSHNQPKCIDCKHFAAASPTAHRQVERCHHPLNGVDLVRGLPNAPMCDLIRNRPAQCGEQGQWFEPSSAAADQL